MNASLTAPPLTGHDRCDRCGAAAKLRAVLPSGGSCCSAAITAASTAHG